jgi:trehalose 6-phosphate synthase
MASEQKRLIIVSNRLPVSVKRVDGGYKSSLSSGGLVTSLSGLTKSTKFSWFGWPGIEVNDPKDREEVSKSLAEHHAVGIFLDNALANAHYNNFSSMLLSCII